MFDMVLNIHMTLPSKKLCEREIARARTYDLVYATFMYAGSSNWFFFIYLRFHFCFMKFNLNRYLVIWEKEGVPSLNDVVLVKQLFQTGEPKSHSEAAIHRCSIKKTF